MHDTSARLFALLSLLQTPRDWPGSELAERLEVTPRTIRRDIDRLRELGYPVEATKGAAGGYRLVAGAAMPPLLLDDDEAVAIAVGLRTAAQSPVEGADEASVRALAKLEQVLPARLRRRVGVLAAATATMPLGFAPGVDPHHLTAIAGAVVNRERLRFAYRRADATPSRRLVEPYRLVAAAHRWYLLAHDDDRGDWRLFRADRIADPHPTGARFVQREIPGGDPAAFVTGMLNSMAPTYEVVATVRLPADQVAHRLGAAEGEVEPIDAHSCRLRGRADTVEWLAGRLLRLGCDFTVHEPPELRAYLHDLGTRALGAATGAGSSGAG
ncbi:helix-turn-helix transcriptional regulator [Nocardiopsis sediminis]|uniref:Helix-turn-helix transcriptional regulator n=1 Tax=Nocardiopsis sediminis TaxID=1778267 RepID=A0ABV8FIN1_9ACTN